MPDHTALLAHIVAQTRQNVEFLIAQNEIPRAAGYDILAKLPPASSSDSSVLALADQTRRLTLPEPSVRAPSPPSVSDLGPPARRGIPPAPSRHPRAKALWGYNESGQEQNDLSFRAGDIVEIVAETNADWWTGKINGRQGLFPSNYVEKLSDSAASYAAPPAAFSPPPDARGPPQSSYSPAYPQSSYQQAPPPPSAYQSGPPAQYQQPAPPQAYNPYMGPPMQPQPPQQQQVAQQQEAPQPKPSKFGGLGQTLATSAAGGVGFGAGSAVGSGLINAIF